MSDLRPDDAVTLHVVPINDLIEHEEDGTGCVCVPDVELTFTEGRSTPLRRMIVHHSLDGRELLE